MDGCVTWKSTVAATMVRLFAVFSIIATATTSAHASNWTVIQGQSVKIPAVAICVDNASVTWSVTGVPPSSTYSIIPNPGVTGTVSPSTLTITTTTATPLGTYNLLLQGDLTDPNCISSTATLVTIDVVAQPLKITSPAANANYQLTKQNYVSTAPIPFTAISSDTSAISWSLKLSYKTSGGRGASSSTQTFTTQPAATQKETYTSIGGQLQATATQVKSTAKVTMTITGEPIPNGTITSQLDSLYSSGATPNLLTGIAERESSYQQFDGTETLYGLTGYWPNESKEDGGSHIGLMMVATTADRAWDWTANTIYGASIFQDKLAAAGRNATKIIKANKGLPALTPVQLENMALLLYGPYAPATSQLTNQYYIPDTSGTTPVWVVNTANNPDGVSYADGCRADIK
jgi:hypothetical protein